MSKLTRQQRRTLWTQRLAQFRDADLTVAEFCRRERVSVPSFYAWRKRLAQTRADQPPANNQQAVRPPFVPLVLSGAPIPAKMTLPGGATIELHVEQVAQTVALIAAAIDASLRYNDRQENC